MTMTVGGITAANERESQVVFFECIKVMHTDLPAPLYFIASRDNLTINGVEHIGFPFQIKRPGDTLDSVPQVTIVFQNINLEIMEAIRSLEGPIDIDYYIVTNEEPDDIQLGPFSMKIRQITGNFQIITGTAYFFDILNQTFPGESFTPNTTPGLF